MVIGTCDLRNRPGIFSPRKKVSPTLLNPDLGLKSSDFSSYSVSKTPQKPLKSLEKSHWHCFVSFRRCPLTRANHPRNQVNTLPREKPTSNLQKRTKINEITPILEVLGHQAFGTTSSHRACIALVNPKNRDHGTTVHPLTRVVNPRGSRNRIGRPERADLRFPIARVSGAERASRTIGPTIPVGLVTRAVYHSAPAVELTINAAVNHSALRVELTINSEAYHSAPDHVLAVSMG